MKRVFLAVIAASSLASATLGQETDLSVSKDGPSIAAADTDVTYTVSVTNLGPDPAVALTLTDTVPAGMTYVSAIAPPGWTCDAAVVCTAATLTAGASADFSFVFHIAPATPPGTTFTNLAAISAETFDPNEENNVGVAATSTPPPPQADLSVSKTGPATAPPNSDVAFTISVSNAGPDSAANVAWSDTLPGTMTFVSVSAPPGWSCTTPSVGSGGTISCSIATLPAGAVSVFTLTAHIGAEASGTSFDNGVAITTDTQDPNEENNASSTTVVVTSVDMSVTKTGPPTVVAGNNVTYTVTVANAGPDAGNAVLNDPLPAGTTFVSLSQNTGPAASCTQPPNGQPGTVTCSFVMLNNGQSAEFTIVAAVGNAASLTNTATVSTNVFDSNTANNSATAVTTVTSSADLAVTKAGPANAVAGGNITYTITVTNNGPTDAQTVSLTDTTPTNTTFVSVTQTAGPVFNCTTPAVGAAGLVTCTIATLAPGAPATFTFVAQVSVAAPSGSTITNTATVASATTDPNGGNNSSMSSATVIYADAAISKSGPGTAPAGSVITYTITVSNLGVANASAINFTDALPAGTTFSSLIQTSGPTFTCTTPAVGAAGTVSCSTPTLASGATATFSLSVTVGQSGTGATITNTAVVTSSTGDSDPANNTASTAPATVTYADPAISKTGPATAAAGSIVTYTITVSNAGAGNATSVAFTDIVPAGTTFASLLQTTGPTFTCTTPAAGATGTVSCSILTLATGASAAFQLAVNVPVTTTAGTSISNTATVTSTSTDTNAANNTSTTTLTSAASIPVLSPATLALLAAGLAIAAYAALKH